jgi:hypothetical protein
MVIVQLRVKNDSAIHKVRKLLYMRQRIRQANSVLH